VSNQPAWMARQQQQNGGGGPPPPPQQYWDSRGGGPPPHHRPYPPPPYRGGGRDDYDRRRRGSGPYHHGDRRGSGPPPPPWRGGGGGGQPRRGPNPQNQLVKFRSREEELEWVEDRRQKRKNRPSKWDVLPTQEQLLQQEALLQQQQQQQTTAASASAYYTPVSALPPLVNPGGGGATAAPNSLGQTRHARRLYIGNLPPYVTDEQIRHRFRQAIAIASSQPELEADPSLDPVLTVNNLNLERRFCFLEFKTVEMTTAAMQLDGLDVNGSPVKIKRPHDYNEMTAPKNVNIPNLDVSKLGIISSTVADGPNKIFIGGLHYHLTREQILELLQAFGKVKSFHLVRNTEDGGQNSKGYCFVEYADPAVTPIAMQGLNGMDIGGGKSLTARLAGERGGGTVVGAVSTATPAQQQAALAAVAATGAVAPGGTAPPANHTVVQGYDVEELVDAALGQKPMPTAPRYFDAMGMPLTRVIPMALMIANAAQEALSSVGAAPVPSAPAPAGGMPAGLPPLPPVPGLPPSHSAVSQAPAVQHQDPNSIPTCILVLHNMVTDDDLRSDEEYDGLLEEVREECAKYGQLTDIRIPRIGQPGQGKIYLAYATAHDAQAASKEIGGRQFGNSVVGTTFYAEDAFRSGNLQ